MGVERAAQIIFGDLARGRLIEGGARIFQLLGLVEVKRLVEQRLLVAEGGIEAGFGDAHRLGQVGHRGAVIALGPEDVEGIDQRLVDAEFARASFRRRCGLNFHNGRYIMYRAAKSTASTTTRNRASLFGKIVGAPCGEGWCKYVKI